MGRRLSHKVSAVGPPEAVGRLCVGVVEVRMCFGGKDVKQERLASTVDCQLLDASACDLVVSCKLGASTCLVGT